MPKGLRNSQSRTYISSVIRSAGTGDYRDRGTRGENQWNSA